jgi:hypothetical protein
VARRRRGEARRSQHVERPIRDRDVPERAARGAPGQLGNGNTGAPGWLSVEHQLAAGDQARAADSCNRLEGLGDSHTECGMQCMHRFAVYLRRSPSWPFALAALA